MNELPTTFTYWLGIIGMVALGIFSIINLVDRSLNKRRRDADEADQKLISRLQATVDMLEKEVSELKTSYQSTLIELAKANKENEMLTKILQGKDERTVEYQKAGLEAMKKGDQVLGIVQESNKNIEKLFKLLEGHFAKIEKSLLERSA